VNTTSFAVLIGRALTLVRRRAFFFAAVAAIAILVDWIVYQIAHAPAVLFTASIVVGAAVDTIAIARVKADVDETGEVWPRVLERLWAVVIVNFIASYVMLYGYTLLISGDTTERFLSIPILLLAAGVVFAESVAVVTDEDHWRFLVVRAIGTSIRTAWSGSTLWRAIVLLFLQFVPAVLGAALAAAFTRNHQTLPSFWSDVPLGILFAIPLDVLIVLAFFDASGYVPKRTCGE
jgi:hypothetical protein